MWGDPLPRAAAGQSPARDRGQNEPHIPPGHHSDIRSPPKLAQTGGRLGAALNCQVCCLCCCCITWSCSGFAYTASASEGYILFAHHLYCLQAGWHFGFHLKQISSLSREENSLCRVRAGHAEAPPLLAVWRLAVWRSLAVGAAKPRGRTDTRRHVDVAQEIIMKNSALFLRLMASLFKLFFLVLEGKPGDLTKQPG